MGHDLSIYLIRLDCENSLEDDLDCVLIVSFFSETKHIPDPHRPPARRAL